MSTLFRTGAWFSGTVLVLAWSALGAGPVRGETWVSSPAFELGAYRFAADVDDATAIFLNPAGLAGGHGTNLYLDLTGDDDEITESVSALQGGGSGFVYRHRDLNPARAGGLEIAGLGFPLEEGNIDTYALAYSFGSPVFRMGFARVWTNTDLPGKDASSWNIGLQSRPHRQLSLGATVENSNKPRFLDGRLRPRYTYGVAVRPLSADPELLTLNVEGSHLDGEADRIDLAYGARLALDSGLHIGLVLRDPFGGDLEVGAAFTSHFGKGATGLRVRSISGPEEYRSNASLQIYDQFWQRSMVGGKRVATLELKGRYEDHASGFVLLGGETRGAIDVIHRIDRASEDRDIRGLALRVGNLSGGFIGPVSAQLEELRQGIRRFRRSGKPVVVYLEGLSGGGELYLASAADKIIMPPLTGIQGMGVSLRVSRYREMFEKLGVEWDADTSGVYKSSFHGFYTDSASAAQREAIQSMVDIAYDQLTTTIQRDRGVSSQDMASIATGRVVFPEECVATGLVDTLGWWEDALKEVDRLAGGTGQQKPRTIPLPWRKYWQERWTPPPAVAVVPAYGNIRSGSSRQDWIQGGRTMGSRTVIRQLRSASAHPDVRAIVFRVDSGGGSALASEEIRQEILKIKEKNIPFIVSMGGVAASGGYWIAMDGDTVFANPSTVTGSIGVVWAVPVLEKLYEKAGIRGETYKRGEHADMMSSSRHFTAEEWEMVDASLDYIYDAFVTGVASGRNLSEDRVREIAQGRVYLGRQALDLGLVDGLGTLDDAVELAAIKTGIVEDYRVLTFRPGRRGIAARVLGAVGLDDLGITLPGISLPRIPVPQVGDAEPVVEVVER